MKIKISETYTVKIFISGDKAVIEQACREFVMCGLCVTVTETKFIYTGGEEKGAMIGLLNYPRFPASDDNLYKTAKELALFLLEKSFQHSVLIVSNDQTEWITKRGDK